VTTGRIHNLADRGLDVHVLTEAWYFMLQKCRQNKADSKFCKRFICKYPSSGR